MFWVFWILDDWQSCEFSFSSEGSQEIARLRNQSSLNLRELRKEYFEDKHLISMDKARKARSIQLVSK